MDRKFETQIIETTPELLHIGDVLGGEKVTEVKRGTKYVTVKLSNGTAPRFLFADRLQIARSVETEDSKAARLATAVEERLQEQLSEPWEPETPVLLAKLATRGHITHWDLDSLANAQARDDVWAAWRRHALPLLERGISATESREAYVAELQEELANYASYGNSRSTSAVSNVVEAAAAKAKADFIRRWWA